MTGCRGRYCRKKPRLLMPVKGYLMIEYDGGKWQIEETGKVGDLVRLRLYFCVVTSTKGVIVINASTLAVEKTIPGIVLGFAVTDDKKVWAAGGKNLISIDSNTLEVKEIALGFQAYGSWGAWHPGSIAAAKNDVFIAKNGSLAVVNKCINQWNSSVMTTLYHLRSNIYRCRKVMTERKRLWW